MKEYNDLRSQISNYQRRIAELREKAKAAWMRGHGIEIGALVEYTRRGEKKTGAVVGVTWRYSSPEVCIAPLKKDGTPGRNTTTLWGDSWQVIK